MLDPREVLEVFEVPLAFLMDEANHQKALARMARPAALLLCHALRGALHLGRDRRHAEEHAPEAVSAMIRIVIENVLLFLLPTAMYVGYVLLTRRDHLGRRRHQRCAADLAVRRRRAARGGDADLLRRDDHGRQARSDLHAAAHERRAHRARPAQVAVPRGRFRPLPASSGADWLQRPETQAVFAALAARGFAARAVGGAVRNALLGLPVTDVDIATTARPDEVIAAAEAAGLKAVPTGIAHGTVTVISPTAPTRSRRCARTWRRTAATRPWPSPTTGRPMRAGATSRSTRSIATPTARCSIRSAGYADLMARRVRFIGDAGERIREDYLRILRFFRFTAAYGEGPPDRPGLAACVRERAGLAILSGERVREEMLRLLAAPRGPELMAAMLDYGLLPQVLGLAPRPGLLARLAASQAALGLAPRCRSPSRSAGGRGSGGRRAPARLACAFPTRSTAKLVRASMRAPPSIPTAPESAGKAYLYAQGEAAYPRARAARLGPFRGCARERRVAPSLGVARALASAAAFPSAAPT